MATRTFGAAGALALAAGLALTACSGGIHSSGPAAAHSSPVSAGNGATGTSATGAPAGGSTSGTTGTPGSTSGTTGTPPSVSASAPTGQTAPAAATTGSGLSESDWGAMAQGISDAHNSLAQSDQDATHDENGDANP